jgi:hypothetical protein
MRRQGNQADGDESPGELRAGTLHSSRCPPKLGTARRCRLGVCCFFPEYCIFSLHLVHSVCTLAQGNQALACINRLAPASPNDSGRTSYAETGHLQGGNRRIHATGTRGRAERVHVVIDSGLVAIFASSLRPSASADPGWYSGDSGCLQMRSAPASSPWQKARAN